MSERIQLNRIEKTLDRINQNLGVVNSNIDCELQIIRQGLRWIAVSMGIIMFFEIVRFLS